MITKLMDSLFAPKYPKSYTGRHRAPARFTVSVRRQRPVRAELA